MEVLFIMLPIFVYALVSGLVLGYVLGLVLPRLRASDERNRAPRQHDTPGRQSTP
ncbi:MAG TPA: hypothetical protein VFY97_01395 [Rhodanobacteraceae bacterium]|nr:hypothetical protein [Rhodanobacteraceae bacterium]